MKTDIQQNYSIPSNTKTRCSVKRTKRVIIENIIISVKNKMFPLLNTENEDIAQT